MEKRAIQEKILRKLISILKWGASHTEEKNLVKSLPSHLRGEKITKKAIKELYQLGFLLFKKSTGELHVSLDPKKKKEICEFLKMIPKT